MADNNDFYAMYRKGSETGLRVPIDDGITQDRDKPTALGSHQAEHELGSINRAVKAMYDNLGGTVHTEDLSDYNNGLMNIYTLNRYIVRECLYGFRGDAFYSTPNDLMSFRGYPTPTIVSVKYISAELNQNTPAVNPVASMTLSSTSNVIPSQNKLTSLESLPVTPDSDYVIILGEVKLSKKLPFDSIYVGTKQLVKIQDLENDLFDDMFLGDFQNDNWMTLTECHGDGSGDTFYFKIYAETNDSHFDNANTSNKAIRLSVSDNYIGSGKEDAVRVENGFLSVDEINLNCTWNGTKWIGTSIEDGFVDSENPSIPNNLSLDRNEDGLVRFNWDESTDNVGIDYYVISITDTSTGFSVSDSKSKTNSFVANWIGFDKEYDYKVKAVDLSGNESLWSSVLTETIPSQPLQVITMRETGYDTSIEGCGSTGNYISKYVFNSKEFLTAVWGATVYNDIQGLSRFNGNNKWYLFQKTVRGRKYSMKIDNIGNVIGYNPCV